MIICMSDMCEVICVTNRKLCEEDFLTRIEKIAKCRPKALILREKDLSEDEYFTLGTEVKRICGEYGVLFIAHTFVNSAVRLGAEHIHLPFSVMKTLSGADKSRFCSIGVSCHSHEEARQAEELGAARIIAGHIFQTDCKKDLPPRGVDFLREVCKAVNIPVYAIGGITPENAPTVTAGGANGVCVMSALMTCADPRVYLSRF